MAAGTDFTYKGTVFLSPLHSKEVLSYVENEFQLFEDDIVTVTYPRSGTHWMMEVLGLIRDDGNPSWVHSSCMMERAPLIETADGMKLALKYPPPRFLTTHLPAHIFPKSFLQSKAKVIYVVRNPKDVFVSLYHLNNMVKIQKDPPPMEEYLLRFLSEKFYYSPWFDHVKGWMELKGRPNFFYITYEELHQDLRGSVERICHFLGKDLSKSQIDSVVENASFQKMKNSKVCSIVSPFFDHILDKAKGQMVRKGVCGDWKNHLTVAQKEHFDRVYQEKMRGIGMTFPWD